MYRCLLYWYTISVNFWLLRYGLVNTTYASSHQHILCIVQCTTFEKHKITRLSVKCIATKPFYFIENISPLPQAPSQPAVKQITVQRRKHKYCTMYNCTYTRTYKLAPVLHQKTRIRQQGSFHFLIWPKNAGECCGILRFREYWMTIEDHDLSSSYDLAPTPPPLPSVSVSLSLSVCHQSNLPMEWGRRRSKTVRRRARKPGPLQIILYSLPRFL